MDPLIITLVFIFGYLAYRVNLPPLIGYLLAGFALSGLGYTTTPILTNVADVGVTILLFTIGLKLNLKDLVKPEVWAGASLHMVLTVAVMGTVIFLCTHLGLSFFFGMQFGPALIVAFGLSFSSTVFAVKVLEENGGMNSLSGKTAIGILIIQDLIAVIYLTLASGKVPSLWAIAVICALPFARRLFLYMMDQVGHSEVQVLFGLFLALSAGAASFDMVGLKADLGALIIGVLIAPHPRAKDMAQSLLTVKDILLVGFFLNIGLSGIPTLSGFIAALILILVLPLKMFIYYALFTRFKLRARTAFVTTVNLANYSEFGLIVCSMSVASGQIDQEWLVVLAIALALSFLLVSPLAKNVDVIYEKLSRVLHWFETKEEHPDETPFKQESWDIIIVGMGRVGIGAYDHFQERLGGKILGIDFDTETVIQQTEQGRTVRQGDITDPDFWRRIPQADTQLKLVVLAIPNIDSKLYVVNMLKKRNSTAEIAAIAHYDDEVEILHDAGVDKAFNLYGEAGLGLASHACDLLNMESLQH
ncbi:cation:proton antiporter domain-containing protein [Desulforhopalus sp. 52FAK]